MSAPTPAGTTSPAPSSGEWTRLPPAHLPAPTFWPAAFGLGITFVFWGLISSSVVLIVGLVVFAGALAGWIADLRHERHDPHS